MAVSRLDKAQRLVLGSPKGTESSTTRNQTDSAVRLLQNSKAISGLASWYLKPTWGVLGPLACLRDSPWSICSGGMQEWPQYVESQSQSSFGTPLGLTYIKGLA